jgi:hypothetical protein
MTAGPIERDPLVADALAAIEVPDHAPGFWERLQAATAPEARDAATATVFLDEPAEVAAVPDGMLEPEEPSESWRRRWARGAARVLVAAAAVAVFAGAGVVLARDDGDVGPDLSDQTTATTLVGDTTTTAAPGLVPEEQVVVDFVDALGRGDLDSAAALLGPRSEQHLVAQSGSVDAFLGEAAEGYGAWSTSTDRQVTLVDGIDVVLLEGTVSVEGTAEYRRLAIPVVYAESAEAWFVDPWAFDPAVEDQRFDYLMPDAGPFGLVLKPDDELEVAFPTAGVVHFSLDGAAPTQVDTVSMKGLSSVDRNVASWTVPEDAPDGSTVVVAFQADSGATFVAQALPVAAG